MFNLLSANLPLIIDGVAVVFILIFALRGLNKGFAKLFISVFGTIISLLLAVLLCSTVTNVLESKFSVVTNMAGSLEGVLTKVFGEKAMNTTLAQVTSDTVHELKLGSWLTDIVLTFAKDNSIPTDTTLNQIIGPTFGYYVVLVIVIIALFIIFKILFFLLGAFIKSLHSLKLVALVDKSLGFALGLVQGIISLELLIMTVAIIPIPVVQNIYASISLTAFTNFIHNINLYGVIMDMVASADIVGFVKGMIKI